MYNVKVFPPLPFFFEMKPPSRPRLKPDRYLQRRNVQTPQRTKKLVCTWKRYEQRRLLSSLKTLYASTGGTADVDHAYLIKRVPQRPIVEIHTVVEALKAKAMSLVTRQLLWRRREEREVKKPIELWRDLASEIVGGLEDPISAAFSQMLIVSSTEPRSLRNSNPPRTTNGSEKQTAPAARTIANKPMTCPSIPDLLPRIANTNAVPPTILQSPASAMGPVSRPPAPSQMVMVTATPTASILQPPSARVHCTSSKKATVTTTPPLESATHTATTAAGYQSTSGNKRIDGPSINDSKCYVDFEKVYRYLSVAHKENQGWALTPMESAVLLDLLTSLPEELPLLDCNKLQRHMKEIYTCLSAPAYSEIVQRMVDDQRSEGGSGDKEEDPESVDSSKTTTGVYTKKPHVIQQAHSEDQRKIFEKLTLPKGLVPLNPFMVPLNLLVRQ